MSDWRDEMRESLLKSYKPRIDDNALCAICGSKGIPLSFNAVEYYQDDTGTLPKGFFPMSQTSYGDFGTIRGSFPVCTKCAPTCAMCGLPRHSDVLVKFLRGLEVQFEDNVHWGCGLCNHFHITDFIKRLLGDETQIYLAKMRHARDDDQRKLSGVFDAIVGKK